ncbi:hypothetical protein A0H81_10910 [Grifola frondosa]|uniref:Uncharacterized protein n=1 Tax=Grifola frondosa TaxID=5627 RepID=A0A1C7LWT5_GRIFR|nr:hypothetical protein A0H81_10910 [Grifola frondosa]
MTDQQSSSSLANAGGICPTVKDSNPGIPVGRTSFVPCVTMKSVAVCGAAGKSKSKPTERADREDSSYLVLGITPARVCQGTPASIGFCVGALDVELDHAPPSIYYTPTMIPEPLYSPHPTPRREQYRYCPVRRRVVIVIDVVTV